MMQQKEVGHMHTLLPAPPWFRRICRGHNHQGRQQAWLHCRFHGLIVGLACEPRLLLPPDWAPLLYHHLQIYDLPSHLTRRVLTTSIDYYNRCRRELRQDGLSMPCLQDITLRNGWYSAFQRAQQFQLASVQDDVIAQLHWKLASLTCALEQPPRTRRHLFLAEGMESIAEQGRTSCSIESRIAALVVALAKYRLALCMTQSSQQRKSLQGASYGPIQD